MKAVYLTTSGLLNPTAIPDDPNLLEIYHQLKKIKWIDLDKGQLEFYDTRPAVAFPCGLIGIEITGTNNMGGNIQMCKMRVTIRLAFDYVGNTAKNTPESVRQQSLEYFDLVDAVYLAIQGKTGLGVGKFDRIAVIEEKRPDGLKVVAIGFDTTYLDKSAAGN